MSEIPDIDVLEDLWTEKLSSIDGIASAFSLGQLDELGSERIMRMPAAMVMFGGMPARPPRNIGHPPVQEGVMTWSIYVIAESMRGPRAARKGSRGARSIGRAIMTAIDGWEIVDGWMVYIVDFRPFDVGEKSKAVYELVVAHQYDMVGS